MQTQRSPLARRFPRQRRPALPGLPDNPLDDFRANTLTAEAGNEFLVSELLQDDQPDVDAQGCVAVGAPFVRPSLHANQAYSRDERVN